MTCNRAVPIQAVLLLAGQERKGSKMALEEGKAGQSCSLSPRVWDQRRGLDHMPSVPHRPGLCLGGHGVVMEGAVLQDGAPCPAGLRAWG